jgi:nucleoside-diphosphate-sugar epimerase
MKALVTGCAGFIGSHLAESLLADGYEVTGVDCFNDNYARRNKLANLRHVSDWSAFEFVPIDLTRGDLRDLIENVDVVFHLAAEPGVRSSWESGFERYLRNNIMATQLLLETMRLLPSKRLVFASSSSVYGQAEAYPTSEEMRPRPFSPYGVTKLAAEHLCSLYHANYGIDAVLLRYFSVYGPRQRPDMAFRIFCENIANGAMISIYGDGLQTRDFTHVSDVVRANRLAASAPDAGGHVLNIGGGSQVSLKNAVRVLQELAGRPLEIEHLPSQAGDVRDTCADPTRARSVLGFSSTIGIEDGLQDQFAWVLAQRSVSSA